MEKKLPSKKEAVYRSEGDFKKNIATKTTLIIDDKEYDPYKVITTYRTYYNSKHFELPINETSNINYSAFDIDDLTIDEISVLINKVAFDNSNVYPADYEILTSDTLEGNDKKEAYKNLCNNKDKEIIKMLKAALR